MFDELVRYGLLLQLTAAASAQIIQVPSPGNPDLVTAIANAPPGSVLRLSPTTLHYAGGVVDKELTIEAATGSNATILVGDFEPFGLKVLGLGAGRFLLRNVTFLPYVSQPYAQAPNPPPSLWIELPPNESGSVVLDHVFVEGVRGGGARIIAGDGVRLLVRDAVFRGASGAIPAPTPGGDVGGNGLELTTTGECLIERCSFFGGDGGHSEWYGPVGPQFPAKAGGRGLVLDAGRAALVASSVVDGDGGNVYFYSYTGTASPCGYEGPGGASQLACDPYDVHVQHGGPGSAPGCPAGQPPPGFVLGMDRHDLSSVPSQVLAGSAHLLDVRTQAAGQGPTWIAYAADVRQQALPITAGTVYVEQLLFLEWVSGSGGWVSHPFLPIPASSLIEVELILQTVHFDAGSAVLRVGNPASVSLFPAWR